MITVIPIVTIVYVFCKLLASALTHNEHIQVQYSNITIQQSQIQILLKDSYDQYNLTRGILHCGNQIK